MYMTSLWSPAFQLCLSQKQSLQRLWPWPLTGQPSPGVCRSPSLACPDAPLKGLAPVALAIRVPRSMFLSKSNSLVMLEVMCRLEFFWSEDMTHPAPQGQSGRAHMGLTKECFLSFGGNFNTNSDVIDQHWQQLPSVTGQPHI